MLRLVEAKDANGMLEWMKDKEIMHSFRFNGEDMSLEKARQFIEEAQILAEKGEAYHFAIINEAGEYLGTVSLKQVDYVSMNAEYAICLRKGAQGKGFAVEATYDILNFAFDELKLNKVYLNVLSDNEKAIGLYKKIGFQYEGEWKKHLFLNGNFCNLLWYAILRDEYVNKRK